jgi:hypothetical protein
MTEAQAVVGMKRSKIDNHRTIRFPAHTDEISLLIQSSSLLTCMKTHPKDLRKKGKTPLKFSNFPAIFAAGRD